jgi:hypothetical protein
MSAALWIPSSADGNVGCGRDGRHAGKILGCHRLLDKVETGARDRAHERNRLLGGKSLVGVRRNQTTVSKRRADRARARRVMRGRIDPNLDLEGRNA